MKLQNYSERIHTITQGTKLWENLEGQKQWNQDNPNFMRILDNAITSVRFAIILAARNKSYLLEDK